ncbi:MAG: hypothetical protein WC082_05595 [Victivallales bacterium]
MLKGSKLRKLSRLLFLLVLPCCVSGGNGVNPEDYPAADKKEWGQLRWVLQIAAQPLGDFTNFESVDEIGDSARRFEIAFSCYFLGAEQYHKFPAWDGQIKNGYDRLIRKMFEKPVWQYWSEDSAGRPLYQPGFNSPDAPMADPIAYRNIMYSGHIGMMIGQYEMLYNDFKWDKPGSIVLKWDENTQFVYDNKSVQDVMFMQMITNPVPGIECEPNAVFPACNQHPVLSWKHYDYLHGTRYFEAAAPLFKKWFEKVMLNQETHEIAFAYLIKQGYVLAQWHPKLGNVLDKKLGPAVKAGKISLNSPCNDGWVGAFMHAWAPELMEKHYPYMKKYFVVKNPDGTEEVRTDKLFKPDFLGFFTLLAAEMGDEETKNKLLERADKLYSPIWKDGTYHYEYFNTSYAFGAKPAENKAKTAKCCCASKDKKHVVVPMGSLGLGKCCKDKFQNDNVQDRLFGMSRALPKSGLWKMYNEPFDKRHFSEPALTDVDIKSVILKRAVYDRAKKALIVSTLGTGKDGVADFKFKNLDSGKNYILKDREKPVAEFRGVKEYNIKFDNKVSHDFILLEGNGGK